MNSIDNNGWISRRDGVVNRRASDNDTWLAPYVGYPASLVTDGKKYYLLLDGRKYADIDGWFTAKNGWAYTVSMLISEPPKQ